MQQENIGDKRLIWTRIGIYRSATTQLTRSPVETAQARSPDRKGSLLAAKCQAGRETSHHACAAKQKC